MLVNTRLYSFIQHFEVIVGVESDHFPAICKVNCAFNERITTNTVTPASGVTNSATKHGFQKLMQNLKRNSQMNLLSVKLTKYLIRYQPMLMGIR